MTVIQVGKGRSEVTITGALASDLQRELRAVLGDEVLGAIEKETNELLRGLKKRWPVRSGRSRDSWRQSLRVHPGTFEVEGVVFSPLRYVRYIKSTKVGREDRATRLRSPLTTEVRRPARAARRRLKRTLPALLAERLQELGDG